MSVLTGGLPFAGDVTTPGAFPPRGVAGTTAVGFGLGQGPTPIGSHFSPSIGAIGKEGAFRATALVAPAAMQHATPGASSRHAFQKCLIQTEVRSRLRHPSFWLRQ